MRHPYKWFRGPAFSWQIRSGPSLFLIAEGSGYSVPHGKRFYKLLVDDHMQQRKAARPKPRRK